MTLTEPSVATLGFFIECNRWSPVSTQANFEQTCDIADEALGAALRSQRPRLLPDIMGFVAEMDLGGPWQEVPLRVAGAQPGGSVDHFCFESLTQDIEARLKQALPLDAVFISSHGSALSTALEDPDGELFSGVRALVGPQVSMVAELDLHTNVSTQMTDALSGFVAYRTNPQNTLRTRGEQAARLLQFFLRGDPGEGSLALEAGIPPEAVRSVGDYWRPKYSVPNARMVEAVQMRAPTEGIRFDPAYNEKIIAGLVGGARAGEFSHGERVLFAYTGGLPSLRACERVVLGEGDLVAP